MKNSRLNAGQILTGLDLKFARPLVLALGLMALLPSGYAQESLLKAETLIRLQSVPLSRPMAFEQVFSNELLDYVAWLSTRALDSSSAWGPANRGWNVYRLNLRIDLEEKMGQRWQTAAGTVRSLAQNPDTSLAQFWSDALSPDELDALQTFYQSATGKKFLAYQTDLIRAYYRGLLVFEQLKFDPALSSHNPPVAELKALWLKRNSLPPESPTATYNFHAQALQRHFPNVPVGDLIFALAAGAVPGTPAMARLDGALTDADRAAVTAFLQSPVALKELQATQSWREKVAKTQDLLPLVVGDLRGIVDLITGWQKVRANPDALPRSIAAIAPESMKVADSLHPVALESAGMDSLKQCLPSLDEASQKSMQEFIQSKGYLKSARSVRNVATQALFVTRGSYGACVPITAAGYPIPAVDSFAQTVTTNGMTEEESQAWYRSVAQEIAANGSSESLVISPNGNAFEVRYVVDVRQPTQLLYNTRFMLAGTYTPANYRTVARPVHFKSIATTGSTTNGVTRQTKSVVSTPEEVQKAAANAKAQAL